MYNEQKRFTEVRSAFMPYCIKEVIPGWHVILNREYKPIGMDPYIGERVDYHPYMVKFRGLTRGRALRLSYNGSDDTTFITLYNDGCIPTRKSGDWDAYSKRLGMLAKMKVNFDIPKPDAKPITEVQTAFKENCASPVQQVNVAAVLAPKHALKLAKEAISMVTNQVVSAWTRMWMYLFKQLCRV